MSENCLSFENAISCNYKYQLDRVIRQEIGHEKQISEKANLRPDNIANEFGEFFRDKGPFWLLFGPAKSDISCGAKGFSALSKYNFILEEKLNDE